MLDDFERAHANGATFATLRGKWAGVLGLLHHMQVTDEDFAPIERRLRSVLGDDEFEVLLRDYERRFVGRAPREVGERS